MTPRVANKVRPPSEKSSYKPRITIRQNLRGSSLELSNFLADGFSMASGNFLGTRAENQAADKARREEELEIKQHPEGEREEIRQIFARKGFEWETLEKVVGQNQIKGIMETLAVGALASGLAYGIGYLLRPFAEGL